MLYRKNMIYLDIYESRTTTTGYEQASIHTFLLSD